jgi:hypothetical protein
MKIILAILVLLFSAGTLFTSCEANKHISVAVFDSTTKKPIDSVLVKVNAGKNGDYNKSTCEGYTNTSGQYENHLMIGCSFGCYDIYMEYSKKGYETKTDFNITEGNIYLSPK